MQNIRSIALGALLGLTVISGNALSQVPQTISFQGEVGLGIPWSSTQSITFRLYTSSTGGSALWTEVQSVRLSGRRFNVVLGSVTPLNLPFNEQYWLGVKVGNGSEMSPRIQLTASPYSLRSIIADSAVSLAAGTVTTPAIADGAVTDSKIAGLSYGKITGAPASLPPSGPAGGDLTGNYPDPQIRAGAISTDKLADGGVTDEKILSVAYEKITGAPAFLPPGGAAGGDLAGNYPDPTIASTAGNSILGAINDPATTGVIGDARLSTNIPKLDQENQFTGNNTFGGSLRLNGTFLQNGHDFTSVALGGETGGGARMKWFAGRYAFRAGRVEGDQWDGDNIGGYSLATGWNTMASGVISTALGNHAIASGPYSMALGNFASTNGKSGAFVYGDNSTSGYISATADNQFMVRAMGGTIFHTPLFEIYGSQRVTEHQEVQGNITSVAGIFIGNGSGLTNLSGSQLVDGSVSDAKIIGPISESKLPASLPKLSGDNTWTGTNTFSQSMTVGGDLQVNNSAFVTGNINVGSSAIVAGDLSVSNSVHVTGDINAASSGHIGGDFRVDNSAFIIGDITVNSDGHIQRSLDVGQNFIAGGNITSTSGTFSGNGSGLTNLNGSQLADASVSDAKIISLSYSKITGAPTSLPVSGTAGGDLTGTYPNPTIAATAGNSIINAINDPSSGGTIAAARISSEIPRLSTNNTFSQSMTVGGDLQVNNSVHVTGDINSSSSAHIAGDFRVDNSTFIIGDITVNSDGHIQRSFDIGQNLLVGGNITSTSGIFSGNGSGLTNLSGSQLVDGSVSDAKIIGPISESKLPASLPKLSGDNTWTGTNTFSQSMTVGGDLQVNNSASVTGNINVGSSAIVAGDLSVSNSVHVTGDINAASSGHIGGDFRVDNSAFIIGDITVNSDGHIQRSFDVGQNLLVGGNITSTSGTFSGNGSGLTNLNGSQLLDGSVSDSKLSANVALQNGDNTLSGTNSFTGALVVPVGTTAQRPASPVQGMIRFNTTTGKFEGYDGTAWVDFN